MPNLYAPLRSANEARSFWPAEDITPRRTGLDYQGRHPEFADTYPTQPAPLHTAPGLHLVDTRTDHGAAHCCTEIDSDSDRDDEVAPMTRGELLALACVMLVAWLAFVAAVSVAWTRWLP